MRPTATVMAVLRVFVLVFAFAFMGTHAHAQEQDLVFPRAAHTPPTAVHHPERQLQRLFPHLPVDQVPRLGTTRHQPVVHPLAIVRRQWRN